MPTPIRSASCSCGQLSATTSGEPVRVSVCHCIACQRRTGSVFGVQARFPQQSVVVSGESKQYARTADSGNFLTFHFCPVCGSTLYYTNSALPGFVGVPVGAFADPAFQEPAFSVYERSMHPWVVLPDGAHSQS
jgi:hypothetical protein